MIAAPQREAGTPVRGRELVLVRVMWMALVILILAIYLAGLPGLSRQIQTTCRAGNCIAFQLTQEDAHALGNLGLSLSSYSVYVMALALLTMLMSLIIAAGILWRQPHNRMAIFVSFWLVVVIQFLIPLMDALVRAQAAWYWPVTFVQALGVWLTLLFGYIFPNGRIVPHWARPLVLIITAYALFLFLVTSVFAILRPVTPIDRILRFTYWGLVLTGLAAQIYRYRRVSGPIERQQTKWVLLGLTVFVLEEVGWGLGVWPLIFPALHRPGVASALYLVVGSTLHVALLLISILFLAIAILRYRLFDIDIIIRRTLIYSMLSASLALTYFGLVIVLQGAVAALGGARSEWVTVASTLAVAALFMPLRNRVQALIDQRFYRRKYDAAKTLAAFALAARDETDLNSLTGRLAGVVQETMEPERISVWLRPAGERRRSPTREAGR